MIHTLASAVATNATQAAVRTYPTNGTEGTFQVKISAACTVTLQGSNDGTNYVTVDTFTATGAKIVALFQFMRTVTAGNTGTVDAWLSEPTL